MLVWLFAMLVGFGAITAGLIAYLPRPEEKVAASVDAGAKPLQPTSKTAAKAAPPTSTQPSNKTQSSDNTAASESGDDKTKADQQSGKAPQKDGSATSTEPAAKAETSPTKPDGSLGVVGNKPDPKPEPLGVPEDPNLGVVADTPKALYEERTKPKTPEWLAQRGGTIESQKAVDDGLNWLARHQGDGGHWGSDCLGTGADSRCDQKAPCDMPGGAYDIAHSGMALLAFQAAGHYYFNGQKYSDNVAKGLDYLVHMQAPDGSIVGPENPTPEQINAGARFNQYFMYEHSMATFALCEACAVAIAEGKKPEPRYQTAAAGAVYFIENMQHADGGWRYTADAGEKCDCSVSGWVMLALKTAREAKIDVSPQTISRMMDFFASHYVDGRTYYLPPQTGTDAMTGVGMMAIEFFQHKLDSPIVQKGAAYLADRAEAEAMFPNYYLTYNCTMAMFQVGGEPWKRWNGVVRDRVTALQVLGDGCNRGSWPADMWSAKGGRVYTTALAVLTLEVYYRFQRVAGQPEEEKFFKK